MRVYQKLKKIVIPMKMGIPFYIDVVDLEIPAFAGMTILYLFFFKIYSYRSALTGFWFAALSE